MPKKTINTTRLPCPLCQRAEGSSHFHRDRQRDYYRCHQCHLIHVPPEQHLSQQEERAEYDRHQNSPDDAGYRKFLSRLFTPMNKRLNPASHGLDFGCGPGPALAAMFTEAGHRMSLFDPFYAPDQETLTGRYDFVTASEVVEHLHDPAADLALLWSLLKPGGMLGVMTKTALELAAFANWHYKQDPTHVCFFSLTTMHWLASEWHTDCQPFGTDVFLFQKPPSLL